MQLSLIELNLNRALSRLNPLLSIMPKRKIKHSINVAKNLNKLGIDKTGIYSAILHDYLERGGSLSHLHQHISELGLPPQIIQIVATLSNDKEDNNQSVVSHLQHKLIDIKDQGLIDLIVLIKISDRIDNLKKRINAKGKIGYNYMVKTSELINYLISIYKGDDKLLVKLLKKYHKLLA